MSKVNGRCQDGSKNAAALVRASEWVSGGNLLGVGKLAGWTRALGGALIAAACAPAMAGPEGAQVVRGQVNITRNGAETLIRAGNNSIINYKSFNIGSSETVRFVQPSSTSRVLNRITSSAPTRIDGNLIANGRVYIINPAGVVFGNGARVDVNALYAAGGKLSNTDFLAGRNNFTGLTGTVENQGTITAKFAGLVGQQVFNSGTINAPQGTVVMASGSDVMIGERTGNVFVRIKGPSGDAKTGIGTENTGVVNASGGRVIIGAGDIYSIAVRAAGTVKAKDISVQASGGVIGVNGVLDASSTTGKGGSIEVLGEQISLINAKLDASGLSGGGQVHVGGDYQGVGDRERAQFVGVDGASTIDVSATGQGDGGTAIVWSDKFTAFYGTGLARGGAEGGNGGLIETSSKDMVSLDPAKIDASASKGQGGRWLIDPRNVTISTAATSRIDTTAGNPTIFTASDQAGSNSNVQVATIETALNGGTSVTVRTTQTDFNQDGNITVENSIAKTAGGNATLRLVAQGTITTNDGVTITSSAGQLNISLEANSTDGGLDTDVTGTGTNLIQGNITTNGGSFTASGVGFTLTAGDAISTGNGAVSITAGTGAVSLAGTVSAGNGSVNVTSTGFTLDGVLSTTSATGDVTINAGSGAAALNANLTTTGGDVSITSAGLTLDAAVALSSGGGNVTLAAGSGAAVIDGALNSGGGDVGVTSNGLTLAATSVLTLNNGDFIANAGNAGTVTLDTAIDAGTGVVSIDGGAMAANSTITGTSVTLNAGKNGASDLTFGAAAGINANTVVLRAGSGNGTDSTSTVVFSTMLMQDATGTAATSPSSFSLQTDAAIAAPVDAARFGGATPGTYALISKGGTVTIADSSLVNGTNLTLEGNGGVGDGVIVNQNLSVGTLSVTGQSNFGGTITTTGNGTFTGAVAAAGLIDIGNDATFSSTVSVTGGGITIGDDVNFVGAVGMTGGNLLTGGDATIGGGLDTDGTVTVGATATLNGNINTSGGVVDLQGPVNLSGSTAIDTTNAGGFAGADVLFGGTLNGAGQNLTVTAGAGDFTVTGATGGSGASRLGAIIIESADVVSMGVVNTTSLSQNNAGGASTFGNITATGGITLGTGGTPLNDINLSQVTSSNLQVIVGALNTVSIAGPVTLSSGSFIHSGGTLDLGGNISTTGGFIQSTNLNLVGGNPITLNSGTNATGIVLSAAALNSQDLTLIASRINFNGSSGSIGGAGRLTMRPSANTDAINFAAAPVSGLTIIDNDGTVDLDSLAGTLTEIHIGNASGGQHAINVPALTFGSNVFFHAPGAGGVVNINGDLSTSGKTITVDGVASVGSAVTVATNTSGATAGANIDLDAVTRSSALGALTLEAGTTGDITISGDVGTSADPLAGFSVATADDVSAASIFADVISQLVGDVTTYDELSGQTVTLSGTTFTIGDDVTGTTSVSLSGTTYSVAGLVTGGASGISLSGGAFTLSGGATTTGGGDMNVVNSGAFTTNDDLTISGAFDQSGGGSSVISNPGNAISLTTGGALHFTDAVSFNGSVVSVGSNGGTVAFDSTSSFTGSTSAALSSSGGDITLTGTGTMNSPAASIDAGTGTVTTGALALGASRLTVSGNEINFTGGAGSVAGTGRIALQQGADNVDLLVNAPDDLSAALDLTATDLAALGSTFTSGVGAANTAIIIGRETSTGTLTLGGGTFDSDVFFRSGPSGDISLTGALTGGGTVRLEAGDIALGGDISSAGAMALVGTTLLSGDTVLTTTAGAITLTGAIDGTTAGQEDLTLSPGSGTFVLGGSVGTNTRLGQFTVNAALQYAADAMINSTGASITGNISATGTSGNRDFTIDSGTGALVLSGDLNAVDGVIDLTGGTITQIGTATGSTYSATATTTADIGGLDFSGDVTLSGTTVTQTGNVDADNYTVTGSSIIIDGDLDVVDAVSLTSTGGVTQNGTVDADSYTVSGDPIAINGAVTLTGAYSITSAGDLTQTADVSVGSYSAESAGSITISGDITASGIDGIRVVSGTDGTGDIAFGATGVVLTSNTMEFGAGDGTGSAAVDVRTNTPTFTGSSGTVSSFEMRQDASIDGSVLASLSQFTGGVSGMVYILNSTNSAVSLTDSAAAVRTGGTQLDLDAASGITIAANLVLESLLNRTDVTYADCLVSVSGLLTNSGLVDVDGEVTLKAEDIDFAGAVSPEDTDDNLSIETFANGRDIFLGGTGSEPGVGGAAMHLTVAELDLFADGFSSLTFGGSANTGRITALSALTFKDALVLRATGAGGAIRIEQDLRNTTAGGTVTINGAGATTTLLADIITQGEAITINDRVVVLGDILLDSTDNNTFATGGDITVGFQPVGGAAIDDAINAHSSGGELTLRAGTGGEITLADVGETQQLEEIDARGASISLTAVNTSGSQVYTGPVTLTEQLRSHDAGSITITGNLTVAGDAIIRTTGDVATDDITITGTINADSASNNRDLTISTGAVDQTGAQGQVTIGGAIGAGSTLDDLIISSDGTTMISASTTGNQTYHGATRIAGNINGSRIDFNDALTLGANVVITATDTDADAESIDLQTVNSTGGARNLTLNGLNTRINGNVGSISKLNTLTTNASGRTRLLGSEVRTVGSQAYLDGVELGANVIMTTDAGDVRFASTIISTGGGNRNLTINTAGNGATQFEGLVGGTTEGQKLNTLTTNADGTVEFSANVRTTGAQVYDDAAILNANVTLSGESFEFATIDSAASEGRSLTVNSESSIIVNGDIGRAGADTDLGAFTATGGNMSFAGMTVNNGVGITSTGNVIHAEDVIATSYTASGVTLDLHQITTTGGQTITGGVTLNDDLVDTGSGSITLNGAVTLADNVQLTTNNQALSVSGAVNGARSLTVNVGTSTATFSGDIGNSAALTSLTVNASSATTRAVGTVGSQTYNGGLSTGQAHTVTGDGDISITGVLTLTGDAVFSTANGDLTYNGVSGGETLTSHAGGAGSFSRFNGSGYAFQKLITEGEARVNTAAMNATEEFDFTDALLLETSTTFTAPKATFRSTVDGAGLNLTANVSGVTDFQGVVGGAGALGTVTTDAAGSTRLAANMNTTSGMTFADDVIVGADIALRGGNGSLIFGKKIDSTTGTPFALSLFSDAIADSTFANTPFRFGGSIGNTSTSTRLKSLTLSFQTDGDNTARTAPLGATAFFATINSDGSASKATEFRINTTQGFTMKPGQKLTSLGNLFINATNTGTVTLGDLTALGNITVTAGTVRIQLRGAAPVAGDVTDLGVDLVASGDISFGGVIPTLIARSPAGANDRVSFANTTGTFNIQTGAATDQFLFLKRAAGINDGSLQVNGAFRPKDLTASGVTGTNAATIIAGAIPRDTETREVATPVTVSAALRKDLELMGMGIKDLNIDDLIEFLVGRAFYRDIPLTASPEADDYKVTVNRLSTPSVQAAVQAYRRLVFLPGDINRTDAIRDSLANAWDAYIQQTENPDGPGFRDYLEAKAAAGGVAEAEALQFLNDTRVVFEKLNELGLSPAEVKIPKDKLIGDIRPSAMEEPNMTNAVLGVQVSSR